MEVYGEDVDSEEERRELEARLYSQIHYAEYQDTTNMDVHPLITEQLQPVTRDNLNLDDATEAEKTSTTTEQPCSDYTIAPISPRLNEILSAVGETVESQSSEDSDNEGIVALVQPEKVANSVNGTKMPLRRSNQQIIHVSSSDSDSVVEMNGRDFSVTKKKQKKRAGNQSPDDLDDLFSLSQLAAAYKEEVAKSELRNERKSHGEPKAKRAKVTVITTPVPSQEEGIQVSGKMVRNPFARTPTFATKAHQLYSSSSDEDDEDSLLTPVSGLKSNATGLQINVVGGSRNGDKCLLSLQESVGEELNYPADCDPPVAAHWSEDMASLYNDVSSYAPYHVPSLESIHAGMSNDPDCWRVDKADEYRSVSSTPTFGSGRKRRYFDKPKRCHNCCETGHESRECKEPKKAVVCGMCGGVGHDKFACSKRQCLRCGTRGHPFTTSCGTCRHLDRSSCFRCGAPGHTAFNCPDNWRRFHGSLTEQDEPSDLVVAEDPHRDVSEVFCVNCGRQGHHLQHCRAYRNSPYPVVVRSVVSYDDHGASGDSATGKRKSKRQERRELKLASKVYRGSLPNTPVSGIRRGVKQNKITKFSSEPASPADVDLEADVRSRLEEAADILSSKERFNLTRKLVKLKKKAKRMKENQQLSENNNKSVGKKRCQKQKDVSTEFGKVRGFKTISERSNVASAVTENMEFGGFGHFNWEQEVEEQGFSRKKSRKNKARKMKVAREAKVNTRRRRRSEIE